MQPLMQERTRYVDGRLACKTLSAEQAEMLEQAIANNRELKTLLGDWRQESAEAILGAKKKKPS
ncbi:MAG: hypothetical protein C4575_09155 [Desulforudis sp.]|nr:MAG: hypothetical protein C4575_09155 [Desulforudis sp.]